MEVESSSPQSKGELFFFFFKFRSSRKILDATVNLQHKHSSINLYFCCRLVDDERIFKFNISYGTDKKLDSKF